MAARTWTLAQRKQQSDAIRHWQPWTHSTGPRSSDGKTKTSLNAYKGGESDRVRVILKQIKAVLNNQKEQLEVNLGEVRTNRT
jgi:hypothetical protein